MRTVAVTVEGVAATSAVQAFAVIAPIDLTTIFRGMGPLPAVVATHGQTGAWDRVGAMRTVELSDGNQAREEIAAMEPPHHFGYRVGPFAGLLSRFVSHADGAWWFIDRGEVSCAIRWTYAFAPRSLALAPFVRLALAPLWRRYARRVLALAVGQAERPPV